MNIDQITNELKNLSDKISLIDSNVKFNLQIFWAIIAVVVAILGIAIYFLVKQYIKFVLSNELNEKLKELKKNIIEEIYDKSLIVILTPSYGWRFVEPCVIIEDFHGYLHIKGTVENMSEDGKYFSQIATLPTNYVPKKEIKIPLICDGIIGEGVITTTGEINLLKGNPRCIIFQSISIKNDWNTPQ